MILKLACNTKRLNKKKILNISEKKDEKERRMNKSEVYYERI